VAEKTRRQLKNLIVAEAIQYILGYHLPDATLPANGSVDHLGYQFWVAGFGWPVLVACLCPWTGLLAV
jgi:hypothetical protein